MASLELAIESGAFLQGAQQAQRGLDALTSKGASTEAAIGKISERMTTAGASANEAFGASRGALKVTQGLGQVTQAFSAAASGAGEFGKVAQVAAGLVMNIGAVAPAWAGLFTAMKTTTTVSRELANASLGVAGGFREVSNVSRVAVTGVEALWTNLKANPFPAVALAIGAVSTAMAIFSTRTQEAQSSYAKLADEMNRNRFDAQINRDFGRGSGSGARQQFEAMERLGRTALTGGESISVEALARMLGVGQTDIIRYMAGTGSSSFRSALRGEPVLDVERILPGNMQAAMRNPGMFPQIAPGQMMVPPTGIYELARMQAGRFSGQAGYESALEAYQRGSAQPTIDPMTMGPSYGPTAGDWEAEQRRRTDMQREAAMQANRDMEELLAKGRAFGETIGDAFYNVASGAQSARQAIVALLSDLGRMASRQAFGALGQSIAGGFGQTSNQPQTIDF
jgi:hypothetical protein